MPIKITINKQAPGGAEVEEVAAPQATVKLKARKSLDGNIIISDHQLMDVVLVPSKNKVLTIPRPGFGEEVYYKQKDFYNSLLGDLETLAKQKQAEGGGVIDLSGYRGAQRQIPQGAFSYGLPGGSGSSGNITAGGAPAATQPKGKQGVFSWGYGD